MPPTYAPSSAQSGPSDELRERVEAAIGERTLAWSKPDTGLTAAHRYRVRLASGDTVFVKAAATPETAAWLRNEHLALESAPTDLRPAILSWLDNGAREPLLIVEALEGYWPAGHGGTRWRAGDLDRVIEAIHRLSAAPAPSALPVTPSAAAEGWQTILRSPEAFAGLRLCTVSWLEAHGEVLAQAERTLDRSGEAFVHGDMRSDNICLTEDGVKFVDWSVAARGARDTDLAVFLPTAHIEGGPRPGELFPGGGGWAAAEAAVAALRAIEDHAAPLWLRRVFRRLAAINLDWAAESLGLASRDELPWEEV